VISRDLVFFIPEFPDNQYTAQDVADKMRTAPLSEYISVNMQCPLGVIDTSVRKYDNYKFSKGIIRSSIDLNIYYPNCQKTNEKSSVSISPVVKFSFGLLFMFAYDILDLNTLKDIRDLEYDISDFLTSY